MGRMRIPSRVLHTGAAVSALALIVTGCSAGDDGGDEEATAATASVAVPAGDPGGHATAEADAPAGDGVTDDDVEAAQEIVADMSDEELTGSVVMLTYNGTDVDAAAQVIEERHLAGAIVMGYNLDEGADADAVGQVTTTLAEAAGERGWPVAIGVDRKSVV